MNPFTDFSSIPAYVGPEIVALIVVGAMVAAGGWLRVRALTREGVRIGDLRGLAFLAFGRRYNAKAGWISQFLIIIPMTIAVGRIYPVINNLMFLAIDWGPTLLLTGLVSLLIEAFLVGSFAFLFMHYLIHRHTLVS